MQIIFVAWNQALPSRVTIYACKEGESPEDFDHICAGRGWTWLPISGQSRPHSLFCVAF